MAILGMRGTGNFAAAERPKNWRQGILLAFPNGDAPLTAILSKTEREQPTTDPEFSWYEKGIPLQRAYVFGAATDTSTIPASGADIAANSTSLYIALRVTPIGGSNNDTSIFKPGHVLYNEIGNETYLVIKKASAGGVDYLVCKRDIGDRYDVDGSSSGPAITGATGTAGDTISIIGSGFPEGAPVGQSIAYQPIKHYNYTQIHRTPLFLTRTAKRTRLRWDATGAYRESKREAHQLHMIEMERACLFGERSEQTSILNPDAPIDNVGSGTPLRTTRGILNWLPTATTSSVSVHTNVNSLNSGVLTEDMFDDWCEEVFRYGSSEKLLLAGSTFVNVLNQLAKNKGTIDLVPTDQTYGLNLRRYLTPFGTMLIYNHPLLSDNSVWRKDAYAIDTDKLVYRYLDDTRFLTNRQNPGDDASKDEFLTEWGLECHFSGATPDSSDGLASVAAPAAHGRLSGVASYGG